MSWFANKWKKIAAWTCGGLLTMALALPAALYIPWVQNKLKDIACDIAREKTGMDISVGDINIDFPLDVTANNVVVRDSLGDTIVAAKHLDADIDPIPLIRGKVSAKEVNLQDAKFRNTSSDSAMVINADLKHAKVRGVEADLKRNRINVADADLAHGKVDLRSFPYKSVPDNDTTTSAPWQINANRINLEDIGYTMEMQPTIDNIDAHVGHATLHDGHVDTGAHTVDVGGLTVEDTDAQYIYPTEDDAKRYDATHPRTPEAAAAQAKSDSLDRATPSEPWKVRADSVRIKRSHARYSSRRPTQNSQKKNLNSQHSTLNTDDIDVSDLNVAVDDFNLDGTNIDARLKHLSGKDHSGVQIDDAQGDFSMNDRGIDLTNAKLKTPKSSLNLDAHVDQDLLDGKPSGQATIDTDSRISLQDLEKIVPDLAPTLKDLPHNQPIAIKAKARGNEKRIDIANLDAQIPGTGRVKGRGTIYSPTDPKNLAFNIDADANITNPRAIQNIVGDAVRIPAGHYAGHIKMQGGNITAENLRVSSCCGTLSGKAQFNSDTQAYDIDANTRNFSLKSFLPQVPIDQLSGHIKAKGKGFDFTNCGRTYADADLDLRRLRYNGKIYSNIRAKGTYRDGALDLTASSTNPALNFDADINGTMCNDHYVFTANGDIRELDLHTLGLYDGVANGSATVKARGDINLRTQRCDATIDLTDIDWQMDSDRFVAESAIVTAHTDDSRICFTFDNEDNLVHFNALCGLDDFRAKVQQVAAVAKRHYAEKRIDIADYNEPMPIFSLDARFGTDGLMQRYLAMRDIDFRRVELLAVNDSDITIDAFAHGLNIGEETAIDTITFHAKEIDDILAFDAHMRNRKGTWDDLAKVDVEGGVKGPTIDFLVNQWDINRRQGYRIGANATLTDSMVNIRLFPENPILAYRDWTINSDNYVRLNYHTRLFDAALNMRNDSSLITLNTMMHPDSAYEDILLRVERLRLGALSAMVPTLPEMEGEAYANANLRFNGTNLWGSGTAYVEDLVYNDKPEGDVALQANFHVDDTTNSTIIDATLFADNELGVRSEELGVDSTLNSQLSKLNEVATVHGTLNGPNPESPLDLDVKTQRFPLIKANAFIPGNYVFLRGYATTKLDITGTATNPHVEGSLVTDSATIAVPRYGVELRIAQDQPININQSYITLNKLPLYGANDNAIYVTGDVDISSLDNVLIDLRYQGENVQVINAKQRDFSELFGKGFINVSGTFASSERGSIVNANATLLRNSNITYVIMEDDISALVNNEQDLVVFTHFTDTTAASSIPVTAPATGSTNINVDLLVASGAAINVFLTQDGQSAANTIGEGHIKYSIDFAGKDNIIGNYNISSGTFLYTPPLISQKKFNIHTGSTLVFNGDISHARLNIGADTDVHTTVNNADGTNHLINFNVSANVTGQLDQMQLDFDVTTQEDTQISSELSTMNKDQRAQTAVNLLLYNSYSGSNANAVSGVSSVNAGSLLLSLVQSQLNSIAKKALPGFEISLGMQQYQGTYSGSQQMRYSYRLSKAFLDNRLKFIIGGEYNTDPYYQDQIASNLFNDVAIEYYLNTRGTLYLRAFRNTQYESFLDTQVNRVGLGFVMRRKLGSLLDLFRFSHKNDNRNNNSFVVPLDKSTSTEE